MLLPLNVEATRPKLLAQAKITGSSSSNRPALPGVTVMTFPCPLKTSLRRPPCYRTGVDTEDRYTPSNPAFPFADFVEEGNSSLAAEPKFVKLGLGTLENA